MNPEYRLKGVDDYAVPFICKLHRNLKLNPTGWGMSVDPTRCYPTNNNKLVEGITMHHYSWIRKNLDDKIKYSTSNKIINDRMDDLKWDIKYSIENRFSKFYNKQLEKVQYPIN